MSGLPPKADIALGHDCNLIPVSYRPIGSIVADARCRLLLRHGAPPSLIQAEARPISQPPTPVGQCPVMFYLMIRNSWCERKYPLVITGHSGRHSSRPLIEKDFPISVCSLARCP